MKKYLFLLPLALASFSAFSQPHQQPVGVSNDMVLVWSDEFNYTGAPDPKKWNFEEGFVRNEELQWYQPQNAYVSDGMLRITAKKEKVKNPNYVKKSTEWQQSRKNAECTSASMTTKGKFDFRYGRVEMRAKVPFQPGAWPAFWTLGTTMPWASCGEIDIMECYYENKVPSVVANVIHGNDQKYKGVRNGVVVPVTKFQAKDPNWENQFHVWTMDWDENQIVIKIDGEIIKSVDITNLKNGIIGNYTNPFHLNQYMLLNLAVSGSKENKPKWNKKNPMVLEVDYVRVYQKKN